MQKLLILGANSGVMEILSYAAAKGIYTIVTDYVPYKNSLAKQKADAYWMISNRDIEKLEKRCRQEQITAIIAGCSEAALDVLRELCRRLHLPCYIQEHAWKISRDKRLFENTCACYGMKVPYTYKGREPIQFPVIVKPVDASACRGISICYTEKQLSTAKKLAKKNSKKKQFLVESYVDGEEMVAFYLMMHGKAYFLHVDGVYLLKNGKHTLCISRKREQEYGAKVNEKMIHMLEAEGFADGPVFIQMMYKDAQFYMFEMGYRIPGNYYYLLTEQLCGVNTLHYITDYALAQELVILPPRVYKKDTLAVYEIWAGSGKITGFEGLDRIKENKNVFAIRVTKQIGESMEESGTMRDIAIYIFIDTQGMQSLSETLNYINTHLRMYDEMGRNMLKYANGILEVE